MDRDRSSRPGNRDRNDSRGFRPGGNRFGGRREGGSGGGFRRNNFDRPMEKHKAVCADCGKECEVPFKPTEGRPVYCNDCFPKHRKF